MDIKLFLLLISITVIPLIAIFQFSPWDFPQIQYFFFGLLFVLRIVFYKEDEYKKNLKTASRKELQKKIKRVPSDSEVIDYIDRKVGGRNTAFIVVIVLTLLVTVIYGKFG